MSSLALVLQHPAIWRGDQYAKVAIASVPTGFAELDAQLPGGGWPRAALTELLTNRQGIGELRLLAPALAHLSREKKWLVLVAPPHLPYAPGFEALGVDLARLIVVRTRSNGESLWATERCLRAGTCAAVIAWPGPGSERSLRRLQLAAEEGESLGVIFGPTRNAAKASPAALRIQLGAGRGRLEMQILKRRGGGWAPPLSLDLDKKPLSLHPLPVTRRPTPSQPVGRNSEDRAGCEATAPVRYAAPTRPARFSRPGAPLSRPSLWQGEGGIWPGLARR
jgi:protein ImuA